MKNLLLIAIIVLGFSGVSFGQEKANATSSATIVTPISIVKVNNMNFGNVAVQSTTAGTVVLTPASSRTATAGVTLPATIGTVSAASFTVAGTAGYTYSITLPITALTITSGSNTMTVTSFTSTPTPTGILTGGTQTLSVGATLNVGAAQAAGLYVSATPFDVIVNYN